MKTTKEMQRLLQDVNFKWTEEEVLVDSEGGNRDVRQISTFTMFFALLVEILAELKSMREYLEEIMLDENKKRAKGLTLNLVKQIITIRGFNFIADCKMSLCDFKQLCFENGWEGTLYKVEQAEAAFEEAVVKILIE